MHPEELVLGEHQPCLPIHSKTESTSSPHAYGTPDVSKVWSPTVPLLPSSSRKSRRARLTRYAIIAAVALVVVIAVVCAAVFATRHKHTNSPSGGDAAPVAKTPGNTTVQDDIQTMTSRRLSVIVGGLENATSVSGWYVLSFVLPSAFSNMSST